MVEQPIPEVTNKDVRRIILRDYVQSPLSQVLSILGEYGKQEWNEPSPRVDLAILKLADGDLEKVVEYTEVAIRDYRDVIAEAEYPRYSREVGVSPFDATEVEEIINDDWKQYLVWLTRE